MNIQINCPLLFFKNAWLKHPQFDQATDAVNHGSTLAVTLVLATQCMYDQTYFITHLLYSLLTSNFHCQNGAPVKSIISKTKLHPRKRLAGIYDLCKGKKLCEGGDEFDKENQAEEAGDGKKKVCKICLYYWVYFILSLKCSWRCMIRPK